VFAVSEAKAAQTKPKDVAPTDFRLAPENPVTSTETLTYLVPAGNTLLVSDVVFQNPASDLGRIVLRRSGATVMELALDSFRTQQHRFEIPLEFTEGEAVELFIDCDNPTGGCTPAVLVVGVLATR
jgi:hypothetical protein